VFFGIVTIVAGFHHLRSTIGNSRVRVDYMDTQGSGM
jgi:hypothetical protein